MSTEIDGSNHSDHYSVGGVVSLAGKKCRHPVEAAADTVNSSFEAFPVSVGRGGDRL